MLENNGWMHLCTSGLGKPEGDFRMDLKIVIEIAMYQISIRIGSSYAGPHTNMCTHTHAHMCTHAFFLLSGVAKQNVSVCFLLMSVVVFIS